MKNKILHFISFAVKLTSGLLAMSPALGFDPNNTAWGLLAFMAISSLKDLLISVGDVLDDGKLNKSFTGKVPLITVALCGLLFLSGCTTSATQGRELTPEAREAMSRVTNTGVSLLEGMAVATLNETLRVHASK